MEQARPRGGHRGAGGPTFWALRLLVAISMVAGLVAEGVTPAAAAAPALWSQVTGAGGPSNLAGAPMAYDPATGQTIMFGGTANGTTTGPQAGTWDWNGSTWAALNPPSSPTARYGASLAYDTTTSQLLLFGCYNGTIYMSDTWSWTGSTWEQLSPTTSPTARSGASLAFDGLSGQMVLFGGRTGASTEVSDTWTWSGSNWTLLSPSTSPTSRYDAAFAYDPAISQMVLFGGNNGTAPLGDTYVWNGSTWASELPATSPSARYGETLAYSSALGEPVLFGGETAAAPDSSTWGWTGSTWAQLSSSTSPTARTMPAMAFDQSSGQMVVFGGFDGTNYLGDTWQWSATAVTAISPSAGPLAGGTSVTITGLGFNGVAGPAGVRFGSNNATSYNVNSSTQITAVAPANSAQAVDITVTNAAGTSTTSGADVFTYEAVPAVTALSPTSGVLAGGAPVTITGTNFSGATGVDFGTQAPTTFTVVNATQITTTSPAELAGTSVDVTVTTPSGKSATSAADQFTYNPVPVVTGLSPNSGNVAGGTPVTITGSGLTGATTVMFGTTSASSYTVSSSTSIAVSSPAQAAGAVAVTVTVPGGTSATSPADLFTYEPGPSVTAVTPVTSLLAGGTPVSITGTNFTGALSSGAAGVMFGTTAATSFTVNSATSITATAPAETAATVDITVTTPAGTSSTSSADQFSYYSVPSWSQAQPATSPPAIGVGGAEAYDPATGQTILFYGTTTWAWNGTTWSELSTTAPADVAYASMAYDTSTSQLVLFGGWSYSNGTYYGGTWTWNSTTSSWTTVATSGPAVREQLSMAYDPATSQLLVFGGIGTSNGVYADTWKWTGTAWSQVASTGPSARWGASMAFDPAMGTNGALVLYGGNSSGNYYGDTWTWSGMAWAQLSTTANPPPRYGADMAYDAATSQLLFFGGVIGSTIYGDNWDWTGTTWVQLLPAAGPPGPRYFSSMTSDAASSQMVLFSGSNGLADTWLIGAPTVTAVSPPSGLPAGGTNVTITGTSFTGATAVDFGTSAAIFAVTSSTQISATTPPGTVGAVDVTVTTPDGTSATSVLDQFSYEPAPTITAVSPIAGPVVGGTAVTVTGTNLTGSTAVQFGTTAASYYVVVSPTEIVTGSPAGAAGTVNITATTGSGTSATSTADQFTAESTPTVTGVSPPTGSPSGGTSVTITGTGLIAASAVKFGPSAAASYTVTSATQVTAVSPAETAGTVDVVVTTPAGLSATSASDRFIFEIAPTVTGVSPSWGPAGAATSVTITGTGFSGSLDIGAGGVQFGTTAAASYVVSSATKIIAVAPVETAGTVDITVTTPDGTSATSPADQYSFAGVPAVSGGSPAGGLPAGGTPVIVTGTYFTGATAVWFGTTAAGTFTITSATRITVSSPSETAGTVDVTITAPSGTSGTSPADRFI